MMMRSAIVGGGQQGAALVIGLIMLALLSILGVGAYSMATMEERMAGNARDQIRAFEAAEASLRDCEAELLGNPAFTDNNGFFVGRTASTRDWWEDVNWDDVTKVRVMSTADLDLTAVAALQPRCIVERLQLVQMTPPGSSLRTGIALEEVQVYRASARGYGLNRSTEAFVQSTYRR